MHIAAWNGHVKAIKALKEIGADISAKCVNGWTPMHRAAWNGHMDVIKVYMETAVDSSTDAGLV